MILFSFFFGCSAVNYCGGIEKVVKNRWWQKVRVQLNLPYSTSSGNLLKKIWMKYFGNLPNNTFTINSKHTSQKSQKVAQKVAQKAHLPSKERSDQSKCGESSSAALLGSEGVVCLLDNSGNIIRTIPSASSKNLQIYKPKLMTPNNVHKSKSRRHRNKTTPEPPAVLTTEEAENELNVLYEIVQAAQTPGCVEVKDRWFNFVVFSKCFIGQVRRVFFFLLGHRKRGDSQMFSLKSYEFFLNMFYNSFNWFTDVFSFFLYFLFLLLLLLLLLFVLSILSRKWSDG